MRRWLLGTQVLLAAVIGVGAVLAFTGPAIAPRTRVSGVDVGGLSRQGAEARLRSLLGPRISEPVVVDVGGRRFRLEPKSVAVVLDFPALARAAVAANRVNPLTRAWRRLGTGQLRIPAQIRVDQEALRVWSERVAAAVYSPARDASVQPTASGLRRLHERSGRSLDASALALAVTVRLENPELSRRFALAPRPLKPKVSLRDLTSHYPQYILVDRAHHRLRLFVRLKLYRAYPIAVGRQGLETPTGLYHVNDKVVNPPWVVPNLPWAGALAGKVVPPGPNDPIKARWIGFVYGSGIHGTDNVSSIGKDVSHGCIRMTIPDVIDLFKRVPMGTPVYIA